MDTPLLDKIDLATLSPMMQQYVEMKRSHPDCLLFFRLGDFYELFFDDALIAAKLLELALTGRDCGQKERAPMCGVPFHAVDNYVAKIIANGLKVAICEQMEDPALAKGLVKREIIRIVTPGTVTEGEALESGRNNYLVSVYQSKSYYGLAYIDITTYELQTTSFLLGNCADQVGDEIKRLMAAEVVGNTKFYESEVADELVKKGVLVSKLPDDAFATDKFKAFWPETDAGKADLCGKAVNGLLWYLASTQNYPASALQPAKLYQRQDFLFLDNVARRNLELTESMASGSKRGSLLGLLDCAETAMGSRMLRKLLEQPLLNKVEIDERLAAVQELKEGFILRQELREILRGMQDLERLTTKILNYTAGPRDLGNLRSTLDKLPALLNLAERFKNPLLKSLFTEINCFDHLRLVLDKALVERPPLSPKEGGIIKDGYNASCDELRQASANGRSWILQLEQRERDRSGIRNLKIGYNRVFGYYIEISKSNLEKVPADYLRKQTLANGERYITDELKSLEEKVLGAQQKLLQLEYSLFTELREMAADFGHDLLETAANLAYLDSLAALAEAADKYNFVRPDIYVDRKLHIIAGRHPVVEQFVEKGRFVPNDLILPDDKSLLLLTGPNMAGKSTFMRQTALIVIMAQMGSFVPAAKAEIGIVDAIYTRIGASDDLTAGQSTFMVEMHEVATILAKATKRSLLIMDEIGRGTSTYDGLAIASAVIETLTGKDGIQARTLFSTHYHELVEMEDILPNVINYHVAVERRGEEIIFLHQIERGGSDDSFGIEVARLAGVPKNVVERANELLKLLEKNNAGRTRLKFRKEIPLSGQIAIFNSQGSIDPAMKELVKELKNLDIQQLSPLDAFHLLNEYIGKAAKIQL